MELIPIRAVTFAHGVQIPGAGIRTCIVPEVEEFKNLRLLYDGKHVHITSHKANRTISIPISSNVIHIEFKDYAFLNQDDLQTITNDPKIEAKVEVDAPLQKRRGRKPREVINDGRQLPEAYLGEKI